MTMLEPWHGPRRAFFINMGGAMADTDETDRGERPWAKQSAADTPRGFPQAFGFSSPRSLYPYPDVASEHRRGQFFGVGPK
ncbi:MAG: hypothetical protein ACREPM_08435, partial [Gemmatimonadaceae bacterium]